VFKLCLSDVQMQLMLGFIIDSAMIVHSFSYLHNSSTRGCFVFVSLIITGLLLFIMNNYWFYTVS